MYPLDYIEPVFRPPSEAYSLILQVTNGCSWNKCTFCDMYTAEQKKFRPKPQADVEKELAHIAETGYPPVRRVFLADGDAMSLSFKRLKAILEAIRQYLPNVQRVSSYCLPRNLKNTTVEELTELKALGLSLMYVGCESGDNEVLAAIEKGETYDSSLSALLKIKQAGMKSSVMILNGMGGQQLSEQHALNSAKLMNAAQPDYLATLVVSFPNGMQRVQEGFNGQYQELEQLELFREIQMMLETLELEKTIFRSDHASNYLILKGVLNKDKDRLLQTVNQAITQPGSVRLRPASMRGL
uniref:Fe-S oxidoreductase n=1 Tax=uncultured Thiotrichaceae bacterium TaxID=298394 RepID=A0A6S6UFE0_9GAMM|nr:MAG: Fe-S oxidoreductase [uncultured Thiotrichaceae bacterium]